MQTLLGLVIVLGLTGCHVTYRKDPPPGRETARSDDASTQPTDQRTETHEDTETATQTETSTETGTDADGEVDGGPDTGTATDPGTDTPTGPTFASVASAVFRPFCLSCHEGPHAGDGVDFTSFAQLMSAEAVLGDDNDGEKSPVVVPRDAEASVLWQAIASDRMPYFADPLSEDQKALIKAWIENGAKP